ncbi:MAG: hypothetical protein MZW92_30705 [Comamonadaceae bacterium]|nr:hypothetical protein [Comamonadaceae bacterium]
MLSARPRPYGVEFALGTPRQAFFLVMRRRLVPRAAHAPCRALTRR